MARGVYRKRKGGYDTWHFCTNCSKYPTTDYEVQYNAPTDGELCNECKAKEKDGKCN